MSAKRSAALGFIFVTLLLDVIGLGIILPVMPKLIEHLTGKGLSDASRYSGWLTFAYAAAQFVFSPLIGGLSDKYGRRPVLLLSMLGFGLDYLFMAFVTDINLLFLGRVIAGITGASMATATAYIADISTPEKRAQNFGLIGAAFGLGLIIGPGLGALLSQWGLRAPFIAAAVLTFLNFIYGLFILPESLPKENRRKFDLRRANPIGSILYLKRYPVIAGLVVTLILSYISSFAIHTTWVFYTMMKFNWNEQWVGFSLMFIGITVVIVSGGLVRIIIPSIGKKNAVIGGLMLYFAGLILFAFATQSWMLFVFMIPYCLGGICEPALRGIMSNQVPVDEQGELQGALTSLLSLTQIIGPLLMTYAFSTFTRPGGTIYFPEAPLVLGAALLLVGVLLAARSTKGIALN